MPNVSETMEAVRWMLNKHLKMAGTKNLPLPKNPPDRCYREKLSDQEKSAIMEMGKQKINVREIAKKIGRSHTSVGKFLKKNS